MTMNRQAQDPRGNILPPVCASRKKEAEWQCDLNELHVGVFTPVVRETLQDVTREMDSVRIANSVQPSAQ